MEIPTLTTEAPTVLVLGSDGSRRREVESLCRGAGLLADHAQTQSAALELFLQRGGHELVLCLGELTGEMATTSRALRAIDPGLAVVEMRQTGQPSCP
ncbi:MAG: hypothetical protein CMJ85_12720 [Planctomycetes bacterium]|jgi:hypothetical protein|nr:hypothetical protein [Planctomycetota bacterium]MDP6423725.1 hypothetical protein [Planctomycetota bacterium]